MNPAGNSKTAVFLFNVLLVVIIAAINSAISTDITLLYLLPLLLTSWLVNAQAGIILSLMSSLLWMFYDVSVGSVNATPLFHAWQAVIRFVLFLMIAIIASRLRQELHKERNLSRIDELTNLANRRHFFETLNLELQKLKRYRHPLTLMYIDVDDFKSINDRFGHDAGDDLLRLIASILKKHTRAYDLAARLGGDEFALLLPETDFRHARETVTALHKRLETAQQEELQVTFSIGSMTFVDAPESADEAVRMADELMYSVKRKGKNSTKADRYIQPVPQEQGVR
jgi:diguanylate cyclase (GGDEF)-like protein